MRVWLQCFEELLIRQTENNLGYLHHDFAVRLLWRVPVISVLEFVVIARRSAVDDPSHSSLETMVISTDERGISYRVERGSRMPDLIWGAMEPRWRTVYML